MCSDMQWNMNIAETANETSIFPDTSQQHAVILVSSIVILLRTPWHAQAENEKFLLFECEAAVEM